MVRGLDQQLMQGQALPVFIPQTQPVINNFISEAPKVAGKKLVTANMFNQTANLVGLSSHLLGTDFDENLDEDLSSAMKFQPHKNAQVARGGSGSRKRASGVSGQ